LTDEKNPTVPVLSLVGTVEIESDETNGIGCSLFKLGGLNGLYYCTLSETVIFSNDGNMNRTLRKGVATVPKLRRNRSTPMAQCTGIGDDQLPSQEPG
jgi:hypothetical protein